MARTAFTAPAHVVQQRSPGSFTGVSTVQPDSAISLFYGGQGLLDHRLPYNKFNALGNGALAAVVGWVSDGAIVVLDVTPPATAVNNIAVAANVVAAVPMTLVSSSGAGIIAMTAATVPTMFPFGTVPAAGSLAIGAIPTYLKLGIRDVAAYYDPTTALTLAVSITGSGGSAGVNFVVRGYDYYGQAMSETIAGPAGATTTNGKKAWKIITSVTPATTDAHNYSVGTTLITGLNLAADAAPYVGVSVNLAAFAIPTTFVAADATTVSATTGDVRGTCVITAVRTIITVVPTALRLVTAATPLSTGLFGVTNFTS